MRSKTYQVTTLTIPEFFHLFKTFGDKPVAIRIRLADRFLVVDPSDSGEVVVEVEIPDAL